MRFRLTCREATRLVIANEDRPLRMTDRLPLKLHLAVCDACTRFVSQVGVMRHAMSRWRAYVEADED